MVVPAESGSEGAGAGKNTEKDAERHREKFCSCRFLPVPFLDIVKSHKIGKDGYKLSQKKRSRPLARREAMKKRSIYVICEHFEEPHNAARGC